MEAGGEHGSVIAEKGVSLLKELWQIGKRVVGDHVRGAIHYQEARLIAASHWRLRDETRREFVVEQVGGERRHIKSPPQPRPGGEEFLRCFSRESLIASRMSALKKQKIPKPKADFELSYIYEAAPLAVYTALTTQIGVRNWWTEGCVVNATVGSQAAFFFPTEIFSQ